MITILKEGVKPKQPETIYKVACIRCQCEFEFEKGDCYYIGKSFIGNGCFYKIHCPWCKSMIFGNDILNLEHREVVVEEQNSGK